MGYCDPVTLVLRIWSVVALEKKGPEVSVWDVEFGIERVCRHLDLDLDLDFGDLRCKGVESRKSCKTLTSYIGHV